MPTNERSTRGELIGLLRGYFACPVLAAFADLGLTRRMRSEPFAVADLPAANRPALAAALRYLQAIGIIESADSGQFRATPVGEYVLDRTGVFHLLRSYRDYFDRFAELLADPAAARTVRRLENVGGTGQMHAGKYFPVALRWLAGRRLRCVADVGCGNGEFLVAALAAHPDAEAVAVDLAPEAVAATQERFHRDAGRRVRGAVADAAAVREWAGLIPDGGDGTVVAIWFVLHEFTGGDPEPVARFFRELHECCPKAEVIVGEVVALPPDLLAGVRDESVYPELLLFHALSGQGVLSWDQHRDWLGRVPYRAAAEERFDEAPSAGGPIPCTVVWHLKPH
jgi:SAM-dependent methyltransferase